MQIWKVNMSICSGIGGRSYDPSYHRTKEGAEKEAEKFRREKDGSEPSTRITPIEVKD